MTDLLRIMIRLLDSLLVRIVFDVKELVEICRQWQRGKIGEVLRNMRSCLLPSCSPPLLDILPLTSTDIAPRDGETAAHKGSRCSCRSCHSCSKPCWGNTRCLGLPGAASAETPSASASDAQIFGPNCLLDGRHGRTRATRPTHGDHCYIWSPGKMRLHALQKATEDNGGAHRPGGPESSSLATANKPLLRCHPTKHKLGARDNPPEVKSPAPQRRKIQIVRTATTSP
mmetsp:Transcript_29016/g.51941  ORF Transcript_29016/g.51941 Transcript_29016/m.51941 type:complete len:228 (-) Transcript_29016:8-691(-)